MEVEGRGRGCEMQTQSPVRCVGTKQGQVIYRAEAAKAKVLWQKRIEAGHPRDHVMREDSKKKVTSGLCLPSHSHFRSSPSLAPLCIGLLLSTRYPASPVQGDCKLSRVTTRRIYGNLLETTPLFKEAGSTGSTCPSPRLLLHPLPHPAPTGGGPEFYWAASPGLCFSIGVQMS